MSTPPITNRLLTVPEAAAYLRVHPITLYRWIAARRIAHVRIGHGVRFRLSTLERFAERNEQRVLTPLGGSRR